MTDGRSVGILASDGLNATATAGVVDVLRAAESMDCDLETTVYSLVPATTVTTDAGLDLAPDDVLIGTPDVVVVPGGTAEFDGDGTGSDLADRVAQLHDAGGTTVGIGTGVLVLGAAGLLSGRRVAAAAVIRDDLPEDVAGVADAGVVDDGDVVTAARPLAGGLVGVHLLEEMGYREEATAIADAFGIARADPVAQS